MRALTAIVSRGGLRLAGILVLAAALAGCGFQLRGEQTLPFKTISVPGDTPLLVELQRNIVGGTSTKLVTDNADAEAVFQLLAERRDRLILSLNTDGRVREYRLVYRMRFRVYNPKGVEYIPSAQVALRRDITFNDAVLAKETEEALLYREMQTDAVQQIMRRLAAAKSRPGDAPEED